MIFLVICSCCFFFFCFFQAEDGIRDLVRSRGLGDVYKRQEVDRPIPPGEPYYWYQLAPHDLRPVLADIARRAFRAVDGEGYLSLIHI